MITLADEAYDFINEAGRNEPDYVKVMKWAVSIHFNSAKTNEGEIIPSHIGNYFSTVRFKDWASHYEPKEGRPAQLALFYQANIKHLMAHGSTTVTDTRPFTVVYAIDGINDIKSFIKGDKDIQKSLVSGQPLETAAASLHELAEEYVRYAKVYWKNDETDAVIVPQTKLDMFGEILKNSELYPSDVKRTGEKNTRSAGGYLGPATGYVYIVPADKVRELNAIRKTDGSNTFKKPLTTLDADGNPKEVFSPGNTDTFARKQSDGNWLCGISTHNDYAKLYVQRLQDEGIIDGFKQVNLLGKKGNPIQGGIRSIIEDPDKLAAASGEKVTKTRKSGETMAAAGGSTSVTIASDAKDFERIKKLTDMAVKAYLLSHPKADTTVDADDELQTVKIAGMSPGAIDQHIAFLKKKNLEFTQM